MPADLRALIWQRNLPFLHYLSLQIWALRWIAELLSQPGTNHRNWPRTQLAVSLLVLQTHTVSKQQKQNSSYTGSSQRSILTLAVDKCRGLGTTAGTDLMFVIFLPASICSSGNSWGFLWNFSENVIRDCVLNTETHIIFQRLSAPINFPVCIVLTETHWITKRMGILPPAVWRTFWSD